MISISIAGRRLAGLAALWPLFLLPAAPAAAGEGDPPSWIELRGEVTDAPFEVPTDAVFTDGEVWAVGPVERMADAGFAVAHWRRDESSGLLRFDRAFTREDLGLPTLTRIFSVARSADGRFLYLGARTFAFEARIVVLEWDAASGSLTVRQSLAGLPASGNEGELLLTGDGRHLYYGSRGIVVCERNAATGLLTRRGVSSSAAVIDLFFDEERGQLYSVGEEVLHVWQRDPSSGALASVGIFDELDLRSSGGALVRAATGRRLARSADGRWLYVLAFGTSFLNDPWSLVVFDLQGVPLLAGWGQGGRTVETLPSDLLLDPVSRSLIVAFSSLPGGAPSLATYPAQAGGRSFGPEGDRVGFAGHPFEERNVDGLYRVGQDLYASGWDAAHWQRFRIAGIDLSAAPTFDGVARFEAPVDLALTRDRTTLLVAVPQADAVARLGYRQGRLGWEGSQRIGASRIALLPNGRHGVLLESDGLALRLFRVQEGEIVELGSQPVPSASEIAVSPDGRLIYVFGTAGTAFLFDAAGERLLRFANLPLGGNHPPRISPDGRFLLVNQKYSSIFPYFLSDWLELDPRSGTYRAFDDPGSVQDELIDAAFSPAGDFIYVFKGSIDPRVAVYPRDPSTGQIGEPIQEERSVPRSTGAFYFTGQLTFDADGRFLYNLRQDDQKLVVYERDPYDGRLRLVEVFAAEDGSAARIGGLDGGGRLTLVVSSTGNEVFLASTARGKVSLLRHNCRPDDERSLCLGEERRFRAEMTVRVPQENERAARRVATPEGDSGLFHFFEEENWESLVKVLDGCSQNDYFWVYAATASDVPTELRVTDTVTGERKVWREPGGAGRPAITDSRALPVCSPNTTPAGDEAFVADEEAEGGQGGNELILGGGRFAVKVSWRTAAGLAGEGQVVPFGSDDSGLFAFFHPENWELLIKVLDGCAFNQHHWVYAAATTDLELRLEVNDLLLGKTRVYTNPLGQPARAITDAAAFECR